MMKINDSIVFAFSMKWNRLNSFSRLFRLSKYPWKPSMGIRSFGIRIVQFSCSLFRSLFDRFRLRYRWNLLFQRLWRSYVLPKQDREFRIQTAKSLPWCRRNYEMCLQQYQEKSLPWTLVKQLILKWNAI